jgi:zinc and cadmium transporter
MPLSFLAAVIGIAGALAGAYLPVAHGRTRVFVPLSGAILLAVSLFSILPEMAGEAGWLRAGLLYAAGYGVLFVVDRYVHPVCPSCSHTHDHGHCEVELHGFSVPLVVATSIHAFIDGWSMTVAQNAGAGSMRTTIPIAVLLHKIPEGLALGVMLRASLKSRGEAAAWGTGAEVTTAVGALVALWLTPGEWARDLLAVAGGTFLFLGFHAVHGALGWRLLPERSAIKKT